MLKITNCKTIDSCVRQIIVMPNWVCLGVLMGGLKAFSENQKRLWHKMLKVILGCGSDFWRSICYVLLRKHLDFL